jgi:hypothetical protein
MIPRNYFLLSATFSNERCLDNPHGNDRVS